MQQSTISFTKSKVADVPGATSVVIGPDGRLYVSTAVGQMDLPLVWAEILMAAIAGSLFYGIVALAERRMTFWHPSQRS